MSLNIFTTTGHNGRSSFPSGVGIFNIVDEPPHKIDSLLFGNLAHFGIGIDYNHESRYGFTVLLDHSVHTSSTVDFNIRKQFNFTENLVSNIFGFASVTKLNHGENFLTYGAGLEFNQVQGSGVAVGVQIEPSYGLTLDLLLKKRLKLTIDKRIIIDLFIKMSKIILNEGPTEPPRFSLEVYLSKAVD